MLKMSLLAPHLAVKCFYGIQKKATLSLSWSVGLILLAADCKTIETQQKTQPKTNILTR